MAARKKTAGGTREPDGSHRAIRTIAPAAPPPGPRPSDHLSRAQQLELYYWMRLTRTLEERLVALYRQTKVVGGLFRSLGQEADAVGSTFALERRDVMSPLIRNMGSMLVKGATPLEILRQYMAKGDSPTRGRELNIHFGDLDRGFIGQISPLGDMVPVMAGVTLSFKLRGEDRVGLVYVGDGATSTGAFHEGINFAAVQRCPLVVVVESNQYAYSTPSWKQTAAKQMVDKGPGYGVATEQADGNDVLAVYDVTKRAVDRARAGGGVTLVELITYRRKGHAEHDNQSYVPEGEMEWWAANNDPIDRYLAVLRESLGFAEAEIAATDARVRNRGRRSDRESPRRRPFPSRSIASRGSTPTRRRRRRLWFREGTRAAVERNERAEGWGDVECRRRRGDAMSEITYLEAIRQALFDEMERDPSVFCIGEDIGAFGGAFQGDRGAPRQVRRIAGDRLADLRDRDRRRGRWGGAHGVASGGRDAVHRLHRQRLTTSSPTTWPPRAIAPSCRARWWCAARVAATSEVVPSTRRIRKPASSTRRGSRSSTRRPSRTPTAS
jgi:TPP-dependent pyruvate/acetoin dehydrogenase alpha subunit